MHMQALRGAVQVPEDSQEAVTSGVRELLHTLFEQNTITSEEVVSVFFSQTGDLRSTNPATAARESGYGSYAYFCLQELDVENSLPRTIRVLIHLYRAENTPLIPVYIGGARKLRPDLFE